VQNKRLREFIGKTRGEFDMIKTFSYVVERKIETFPIEGKMIAYRDVSEINGKEISKHEGISTIESIELVKDQGLIKNIDGLYLFKEEVVEKHRNQNIFHYQEDMDSVLIRQPYSYLEENGKDGVIVLRLSIDSHDLYFINGEPLMKPVYFDNANGLIGDEYYDLDAIVEKIKDHPNIIWNKSRNGSYQVSTYNGDGLNFRLVPSNEIWEQIKDSKSSFELREYVKANILDIEQFKK
jgi:hypothetical protein